MTNDSVIKLTKMGFGEDVIVNTINRSQAAFDTSPEGLAMLKSSGVGALVVSAMLSKASPVTPAPAAGGTMIPPSPIEVGASVLREGTDGPLKFAQDISSKTATEGDPVVLVLDSDLKVGNVVVARAGSRAFGEITKAEKSGMLGKAGDLSMKLTYLKVGDNKIKLRGVKGKEGESGTTGVVILTVLFGPLGLIKHGKNIEIKQGTALAAFVADDITLPAAR